MWRLLGNQGKPDWPTAWQRCPLCGRELAGGGRAGARIAGPVGPMWLEPPREELVARCPVHGRPPFNRPAGPGAGASGPPG